MDQKYTVEEVIQFTINILAKINVPGIYVREIGIPIMNAIDNLTVLKQKMSSEAKEEDDDGTPDPE